MAAISIDTDKCVGCGRCVAICIRDSIEIVNKKAVYVGNNCFSCFQCYSICPKNAASIQEFSDFEGERVAEKHISYDDFMKLLKDRRSMRWFTEEKVTRNEFEKLFAVGGYSPSGMNYQDVEFVVVDKRMEEFMAMIYEILKPDEYTYPRIHDFCRYVEGGYHNPKGHPFLWEGKQIILSFSEVPVDAVIATVRLELAGYTMGLGGFYSLFMIIAAEKNPERFSEFFPEISAEKKLHCVYVIGHPRVKYLREVPPRRMNTHYM